MKKISATIIAVISALFMTISVFGEFVTDTNILSDYTTLVWDGDDMYFENGEYPVMFFGEKNAEAPKTYTSSYTIDLPEITPSGFYFSIEMGNNYIIDLENPDTISAQLKFLDADGNALLTSNSGEISENKEYHAYSLGTADKYYAVPDGAVKCQLTLTTSYNTGSTIDAFYRNLNLTFSSDKEIDPTSYSNYLPSMSDSGAIASVQSQSVTASKYIWIGIIFVVALVMFLFARKKNKIAHENVTPIDKKKNRIFKNM